MSSPILDMENINMRLGPSNMGRRGNGRGVHFWGGYYAPPYCGTSQGYSVAEFFRQIGPSILTIWCGGKGEPICAKSRVTGRE